MGIFAPITLKLRLLLQALWQLKLSWDDPIPDAINVKFITFVQDIRNLNQLRITRCLKSEFALDTVELHGFSDGGEQAYGAAVWLRWHTTIGVALTFVAAKAYVAPLKKRSIPRLELMGMVVLTRLVASIKSVINVTKVFLWTDSATVLHWLSLPASNFKPFVSTCIQEIKETLPENADCFRYVNWRSNLADALTKPIPASKLSLWHKGPRFLLNPCEKWPSFDPLIKVHADSKKEEKSKLLVTQCVSRIDSFENDLTRRISSGKKLVRVVAWLKRLKRDENQKPPNLTADELLHAKLCLFWLAQGELRKPEKQSIRQKLNLEMSDDNLGVLRIHGRLDNFHGDEPILRPIALPSKSKLVRMYAEHMHQSLGHQGYRVIIVNLRKNGVYIIRGKQLLKSIAAKCIKCRIIRRELLTQQMGQLLSFRFKAYCPPFTSVAMDFFGPVKIKKTRNIAISGCALVIACNTTRIIHLEITETQSTDDFLLAWRRFVTKRGIHPLHVYTDQGKTFVGAQKYI